MKLLWFFIVGGVSARPSILRARDDGAKAYWSIDSNCNADVPKKNDDWPIVKMNDYIRAAIEEAVALADNTWKFPQMGGDGEARLWFGISKASDRPYAVEIKQNLENVAGIVEGGLTSFMKPFITIDCKDRNKLCGGKIGKDTKDVAASVVHTPGWFADGYTISVCKRILWEDSLVDRVKEFGEMPKSDLEMRIMQTRGQLFLHELMHVDLLTERPVPDQNSDNGFRIQGAQACAELAARPFDGTTRSVLNADNYAQFAQGMDYHEYFGVLIPAIATNKPPPALTCASASPVSAHKYVTRDNMYNAVGDFCNELVHKYNRGIAGSLNKQYYGDTPEGLSLTARWRQTAYIDNNEVLDECVQQLMTITDSCDSKDNPMNWKHGGEMDGFKVWGFSWQIDPLYERPQPPRAPIAGCNVWWKLGYSEIDIWGAGFANNDWGGEKLLGALKGCMGLTLSGWWFTYNTLGKPSKDGIEWNAGGNYPIGPNGWTCVANAIAAAGGPPVTCGGR